MSANEELVCEMVMTTEKLGRLNGEDLLRRPCDEDACEFPPFSMLLFCFEVTEVQAEASFLDSGWTDDEGQPDLFKDC